MGTTTVKKGANRAAHNAKTSRAAQRTPLPPRNEPVERSAVRVAREMVADAKAKKVTKAERLARSKPVVDSLNPPAAGGGRRSLAEDAKIYGPKVEKLRGEGVSWLHIAQACGREGNLKTISVWADRVYRTWTGGKPDNKPTSKNTRTPAEARPVQVSLPWVQGDATDQEIISHVTGHSITWRREIDGRIEEDIAVKPARPLFKKVNGEVVQTGMGIGPAIVVTRTGRKVLNFVSPEGMRSVHVDAILAVK